MIKFSDSNYSLLMKYENVKSEVKQFYDIAKKENSEHFLQQARNELFQVIHSDR